MGGAFVEIDSATNVKPIISNTTVIGSLELGCSPVNTIKLPTVILVKHPDPVLVHRKSAPVHCSISDFAVQRSLFDLVIGIDLGHDACTVSEGGCE